MRFSYKLEHVDGTPADPPRFRSLFGTSWNAGDAIPLGGRTLRVVDVCHDDEDDPVVVIQDMGE